MLARPPLEQQDGEHANLVARAMPLGVQPPLVRRDAEEHPPSTGSPRFGESSDGHEL